METRKVQLSGGTTYTISLPKSWAQEHGIDTDSLLSLYPNGDGSLLVEVLGDESSDDRTADVDVATTSPDALAEQLVALYTVGFDEVVLRDRTGHPEERRRVVESAIDGLSGFELLEASDTRIRLQNLVDAENVDIRKSALRLRLVVLSMHRDAVTAIVEEDADLAERVIARDSEADKLFAMVTRHFRRSLSDLHEVEKLEHSRDRLFEYYYVCRQFERIADHAVKMAAFVPGSEYPVPDAVVDRLESFAETARSIFDDAADVVLADADVNVAHTALATHDELVADIDAVDRDLYDHGEPDAAYTTGLLLDSIRRTAGYGANIASIGIQQSLRTEIADR
jgi:phosphate uptake regulator